jgi:hypothetical protein
MPFATTAKNAMLDGLTVDRIRLHSGDPGSAGTDNALGAGLSAATFSAASSAERVLASDVTVTGLSANQSVTHFSVWLNSGTVFRGGFAISAGDVTANAAGEYTLKATDTKLRLLDPS